MSKLIDLADAVQAAANEAFKTPPCSQVITGVSGKSCIAVQTETTYAGGLGRSWDKIKPQQLCLSCHAYWCLQAAASDLRALHTAELRREAEARQS